MEVAATDPVILDEGDPFMLLPAPIILLLTEHTASEMCEIDPLPATTGELDEPMIVFRLSVSLADDALSLL